jgi:hypothetical protein
LKFDLNLLSFSSINIEEKVFWVSEFIPSKIFQSTEASIKKNFIEVIELLQNCDLIEKMVDICLKVRYIKLQN